MEKTLRKVEKCRLHLILTQNMRKPYITESVTGLLTCLKTVTG